MGLPGAARYRVLRSFRFLSASAFFRDAFLLASSRDVCSWGRFQPDALGGLVRFFTHSLFCREDVFEKTPSTKDTV